MDVKEESFFIFTAQEEGQSIDFVETTSGRKIFLAEPHKLIKGVKYEILLTSDEKKITIREYEEA